MWVELKLVIKCLEFELGLLTGRERWYQFSLIAYVVRIRQCLFI